MVMPWQGRYRHWPVRPGASGNVPPERLRHDRCDFGRGGEGGQVDDGGRGRPSPSTSPPPEAAAVAYLRDVVGHAGWPLQDVTTTGTEAVARYILQDVPAEIRLAQQPDGPWYVTGASSDLLRPGVPVLTDRGVDIGVGPGPRTYETGSPVRLTALAADGRLLASATVRVTPSPAGAAAARTDRRTDLG